MVLLHHPIYHAILQGFLALQKNLAVRLEEPALHAALENLPKLYQVWSTLHVLDALLAVAKEQGYLVTEQNLARKDKDGGIYIQLLPDGKPIVILTHPIHGTKIKMIPERTYPQTKHAILRSISYEQRPDIAIEVYPLNKAPCVYLFDPKYKLRSEGDGEKSPQPKRRSRQNARLSRRHL